MKCLQYFAIILGITSFLISCGDDTDDPKQAAAALAREETPPEPPKEYLFGYDLDSFEVVQNGIKYGESLGKILNDHGVGHRTVHYLAKASKEVFDVRDFKVGNNYHILKSKADSIPVAEVFIYQEDKVNYYIYDFRDSIQVSHFKKDIEVKIKTGSGEIESSLWEAVTKAGLSQKLVMEMADGIYPWSINFFSVQKGDKFKVVYEARYVEGEFIGIGEVLACNFYHGGKDYYAFNYDGAGFEDFYDDKGNNLRKFFLKAPVSYTRISSKFTKRRYHPVQKRWKAHKGTDFAAPKNTPIYSTADGVVTKAEYGKFNGRYVKVQHNKTFTTQYLHMNKIAKGIRPGKKVSQGEVIGYVGKTGLATGYHVCYRFWKNGTQVDPFKVKLPPSEPISDKLRPNFESRMIPLKEQLDAIPYPSEEKMEKELTENAA
jgi:murein DD-endopeptidase MepM/ murein hydrolase activator NlpD